MRKRKCDEKVPICSACKALELECHGYGEQPAWMDRGSRQKAEAMKIKQMVAEVRRRRRRRESSSENVPLLQLSGTNSHSRGSSLSSISITTPTTPATPPRFSWGPEPSFPLSSTVSSHSDGCDSYFAPLHDGKVPDYLATDVFFPEPQVSSHETELFHSDRYAFECELVSPTSQYPAKGIANPHATNMLAETHASGHSPKNVPTAVSSSSVITIDKVEDAMLLAYYFEKVFNWQFPSSQFHNHAFNQGHIMWLVYKSQPLYHAILALSSSHKSLQKSIGTEEHTAQYESALRELHNELREPKSYEDISLLACIVMFLHSAVCHTPEVLPAHTENKSCRFCTRLNLPTGACIYRRVYQLSILGSTIKITILLLALPILKRLKLKQTRWSRPKFSSLAASSDSTYCRV